VWLGEGVAIGESAQGVGTEPTGVVSLSRTAEGVDPALLKAVFAASRPAAGKVTGGTAVLSGGDVAVFAVSAVRTGTLGNDEGSMRLSESARRAAGESANAEFTAYVRALERSAKVKRNEKVFE
jgi:hypothetical protein